VPVREVDGRTIGDRDDRPTTRRLRELYQEAVERDVARAAAG
jgi:branched-subunit amino acid aminotransferase/4-amino-4-deoxychorismate lyase